MQESELVQQSKEGNRDAFGMLVKKYKKRMFNLAFSLTHNRDVADDLTQEAFIKAYFALPQFKLKSEFGTWLYRITINHTRDYLRKRARMKEISLEEVKEPPSPQKNETGGEEMEREEEQRRKLIGQAIQTLPEKYQIILALRDVQGYSYEEISKILKISPGTVDSRLHRARKLLRKKMIPFIIQEGGSP